MLTRRFVRSHWAVLLLYAVPSAAAPAPSRYLLRHRVAVGDRQLWESSSDASLTLTTRTGDQEAAPVLSATLFKENYVEEVLATGGSRVTALRQHCLVARTIAADPSGKQVVEPSSLEGTTVTIRSQAGKTTISAAGAKLSADDRDRLSHALEQAHIPFLPDRETAIGEAWTVNASQLKDFFPQARRGSMQARFQEVTRYAGRQCAHIHLTGALELNVEGLPVPVKAELTGELYHALGIQRPVAVEFAGPLSVDAQVEQGGRSLTLHGEGKMAANVTIQWQKIAGKPVPARKAAAKASAQPELAAAPGTVRCGEARFQLPGPGWKVLQYNQATERLETGTRVEGGMLGVRQRFYVFMWADLHPKRVKAHNLEELDAVVRTLYVSG